MAHVPTARRQFAHAMRYNSIQFNRIVFRHEFCEASARVIVRMRPPEQPQIYKLLIIRAFYIFFSDQER